MTFTPIPRGGAGRVERLPIIDPNDRTVPPHIREKYGGRRWCVWWERNVGYEGNPVVGGVAPPRLTPRRKEPKR
jgi:hypothetical protein